MKDANPETLRLARTRHASELPGEYAITPEVARLLRVARRFQPHVIDAHERPEALET